MGLLRLSRFLMKMYQTHMLSQAKQKILENLLLFTIDFSAMLYH